VVDIDPGTAAVTVRHFVAVDDCGVAIDPEIVEDQTRGGIVQGLGQALYEVMPYDDQGVPQADGLLGYLLPTIGELDVHLLGEGRHQDLWDRLGAHVRELDGVVGTAFAVWAPSARAVSVEEKT